MRTHETEVCIVGAGPSGLVTAIGLARSGVPFVVVDADDGPVAESRGLVVHAGALEVLEHLGLAERLLAAGRRMSELRIAVGRRTLARVPLGEVPTPYPFFLAVPQATTESILYAELGALGRAPLGGHRVTDVTERDGRYVVGGADRDGAPFRVRARYLVGADGLHSTVRDALGIGFVDRTYGTIFQTADVRLRGVSVADIAYVFPSRYGLLFMTPIVDGMWRLIVSKRHEADTRPVPPGYEQIQRDLSARALPGLVITELVRSAGVVLHHGLARSFVRDRAALIGDAAHVHSPAGGMGMNTGIQDAFDLAATLAQIHRGAADPATALAAFSARRRRAAREVLGLTDRMMRLVTLDSPGLHAVRTLALAGMGRIPAVPRRIALTVSCVTRAPERTGAPALLGP